MKFWAKGFFSADLILFYLCLFLETVLVSFPYDNFHFDGLWVEELRAVTALALACTLARLAVRFAALLTVCGLLSCLLMAAAQHGPAPLQPDLALTGLLFQLLLAASRRYCAVRSVLVPFWLPGSPWWQRRARRAGRLWRRARRRLGEAARAVLRSGEYTLDLLLYLVCLDWPGDLWTWWLSLGDQPGPRPLRVNCYPKFTVDEFCGDF
ncbi:hypothetical protein FJT64_021177 [Amphibalanus amphitrite]|uniref:Uncharacterized protein n=1 Tax=Amphibalanus amphitrite TaxID=1232801 RepID=A0A6A4WZ90_AMPAM|nr:hypothetical protein FJT64_021177 [Amphibalanus amphitrite]